MFIATLCIFVKFKLFDPIPIIDCPDLCAWLLSRTFALEFIRGWPALLSLLPPPSAFYDPPLPRNPLKNDFLDMPLAIELITLMDPFPWFDSLDEPLMLIFGGGREILPLLPV